MEVIILKIHHMVRLFVGRGLLCLKLFLKRERNFVAIAICGGSEGQNLKGLETDFAFPCGICRQVLREFVNLKNLKYMFAQLKISIMYIL